MPSTILPRAMIMQNSSMVSVSPGLHSTTNQPLSVSKRTRVWCIESKLRFFGSADPSVGTGWCKHLPRSKKASRVNTVLAHCEDGFWTFLAALDCSKVNVKAQREGTFCFPRIPLIVVEGPLAITQLLETTLLNCVNYASLLATNAARFRAAVGPEIKLYEFGLRRAQGPDGGVSASRYSFLGGFDGTTNALAGHMCEVPLHGTMAHALLSEAVRRHAQPAERIEFTCISSGECLCVNAWHEAHTAVRCSRS